MNSNEIIWVILLNSNTCRIFKYSKQHKQIDPVKEFNQPENRLNDNELTSDKPGRYQSSNSSHGAYSPRTDPKEIKIDQFVREIANELDHSRNVNAYHKLIIIAADHTNGLLMKHLNKNVKQLIYKNVEKDLIKQTPKELLSILANLS